MHEKFLFFGGNSVNNGSFCKIALFLPVFLSYRQYGQKPFDTLWCIDSGLMLP